MATNETYKEYAWKSIFQQVNKNRKDQSKKYYKLLEKYEKLKVDPDGAVTLNIDDLESVNLCIYTTGELWVFLLACMNLFASDKNSVIGNMLLSDGNIQQLVSKLDECEVDADPLIWRDHEYRSIIEEETVTCVSTGTTCHSEDEKMAAVFTDCVVACEIEKGIFPYCEAAEKCVNYGKQEFARDLFKFAINAFHAIEEQARPFIGGSIIGKRKLQGVCPNCGGSFKGFFKKKCEVCGTPKS